MQGKEPSPILEELKPDSDRLYIIFGGILGRMGMPPFEFFQSSHILNENKIFLRDFYQSWYQCGLPGIAANVFEIGDFLNKKILTIKPKKIFFVGNSMGGYAAMLFAAMLSRGKALAFSPQTFISPSKRGLYNDNRWELQINRTYGATSYQKHIYDLKDYLQKNNNGYTIKIFVSRQDNLDYIHAKNIAEFRNVTIHEFGVGGHSLVKYLRDTGRLVNILRGENVQ